MVYPSTVPKERLPIPKEDLKTVKRKGLVAHFRLPTLSANSLIPIGYDADIDDFAINNISHQTGENRTAVKLQAESIRLDAGTPALDLGPTLPLQGEVGPVRNVIEPGESIEADNYGMTRSSMMKGMRVSLSNPDTTNNVFYVDSGAGQCLSSCSNHAPSKLSELQEVFPSLVMVQQFLSLHYQMVMRFWFVYITAFAVSENSNSLVSHRCRPSKVIL
jgi:hypothetical protein